MVATGDFGAFFRETRKSLGLSLREFCRRTGFDAANVSRLERGLLAPPKSEKVLAAYGRGLKLKAGSSEWDRFISLAKPAVRPRRGKGHKNWVTARHLEEWAGTLEAQSMLPQLIRRLIRATAEGTVRLEMPSGEQTQRPGWDGLVEADGNAEFVPQGVSAWEMGVDKDAKTKAEKDFGKRLKSSPGVTGRKSTFIFVTPRKWQKKGEWVEEKTILKSWKEIRVYDSATLEEWLESAPAVDLWFARHLGLYSPGLTDVDEYWENLRALTNPSFESDVYLASRGKQLEELRKWLGGPPDSVVLESRSPSEAFDFVVAVSRKPELEELFAARSIIVETRDAWRSIVSSGADLVLLAHPKLEMEAELVAEAIRKGHHVLVLGTNPVPSHYNRIKLPRVSNIELQKTLEAQGVEHHRAAELTNGSGGSITVLKRLASRYPGTIHPEWSKAPHAVQVVPHLLAGSWNDTSEGDQSALEELGNTEYQEVSSLAQQWSSCPDPLLTKINSRWDCVSREDSWMLTAHAISDADLKRFREVALKVLGEMDPFCDLPIKDSWKAPFLGKEREYSNTLRTGIAETLALLGARSQHLNHLLPSPKELAAQMVKVLLKGKDWKTWSSLSKVLPLLAEAAPDAFLSSLESDLDKPNPEVGKLFEVESSGLFGQSPFTGLLFALEALAWDTQVLSRVSLVLAHLSEIAPETKLRNHPIQTLTQVFLPWYPQTTATVEERIKILEVIAKKHPIVGWHLLIKLLPEPYSNSLPNNRPIFQNWAIQWAPRTSRAEYKIQVDAISHLLVKLCGKDPEKLKELISSFESLPPEVQKKLLHQVMEIQVTDLKNHDRQELAGAIREKANRHRCFSHTDWALKGEVLEDLERARVHLEPEDIIAQNAWLFDDYWKVYWEVAREKSVEGPDNEVENRRTTALKAVREEKGWKGVLALAKAADKPGQVGDTLALTREDGDDARVLPTLLTDSHKKVSDFAKGYIWARKRVDGWKWLETLTIDKWTDDQILEFALALPSEREAWRLVAERGNQLEAEYWTKVKNIYSGTSSADVSEACQRLVHAGRPIESIMLLVMAQTRGIEIESADIIKVLELECNTLSDFEPKIALDPVRHDIQVLIQELQKRVAAKEDIDINKVANLEWAYLEWLDGHPTSPKVLLERLANNPDFFVKVLAKVFRREDESEKERSVPSGRDERRAMQAYRLLTAWMRVPGAREDGSVDAENLRAWVKLSQSKSEQEGRRSVADSWIGQVFAHAPQEEDGSWPSISVRDAIEEFGSDNLIHGFEDGILKRREAYLKGPDEGGAQERKLSKQYFDWAKASKIEWPKTAASLQRMGERYESDARREDVEAESP